MAEKKSTGKKTKKADVKSSKNKTTKALTLKERKKLPVVTDDLDDEAIHRGDDPMSIVGHLDELRSRFIVALLTIVVITAVSIFFSENILHIITKPFTKGDNQTLVVNQLTDGFMLRLKAAFLVGILVGLPVIFFELWKYISPAVEKKDRRFISISLFAALFLMWGGIVFAYFLLLPVTIKVLLLYTPSDMQNLINASDYLSFIIIFCISIGAVFELPIIVMILTKIGILTPEIMIKKRKYALVIIWVLAAIITPTQDPLNLSLMAIPMMLLYEISVIISKLIVRNKLKKDRAAGYIK